MHDGESGSISLLEDAFPSLEISPDAKSERGFGHPSAFSSITQSDYRSKSGRAAASSLLQKPAYLAGFAHTQP